jgi:hypothetical protein
MHLAPKFWKSNVKCYELTLIMQQTNTKFIKTLNKFHTYIQIFKYIQYINSNYCQKIPKFLTTPHYFYTNILVQRIIKLYLTKQLAQHLILRL